MKRNISSAMVILTFVALITSYFLSPSDQNIYVPTFEAEIKRAITKLTPSPTIVNTDSAIVTVTRVIDGDTVELNNGEKLRYIGIDAPEKQNPKECFSGESVQANKDLVLNKQVRLVKDKTNRDRYGRLLRYVYVQPQASGAAELFVNDYLVRNGFAFSKGYRPDVAMQTALDSAQREASASGRGLWTSCK